MFYQVRVTEDCRDMLRFLWWENGDTSRKPKEYRMTVHLFVAVASSPACANYTLKRTADDNEDRKVSAPADLRKDFYIEDCLKSVPTADEAIKLIEGVKEMCKRGGLTFINSTQTTRKL